jgi:hypothetical protein
VQYVAESFWQRWRYLLLGIIIADLLVVVGVFYLFTGTSLATVPTPRPTQAIALGPTATATIKPWTGPPQSSPTATPVPGPPTPIATDVLAESGFPIGFTPTPRPTRQPVYISLPQIYPLAGGSVDVPVVNQILYPEPFFAPGTNSACGPVALYAAAYGLGIPVDYSRLRDIAVTNGFGPQGISTWGLVNTIATINSEIGSPFSLGYGDHYRVSDLIKHLRQKGVAVVLVYVRKENGRYRLTTDGPGAIGHFLLVEQINPRSKKVKLAGSTLGMDEVSLAEFVQSWTNNPQASYSQTDVSTGWALILKPSLTENP